MADSALWFVLLKGAVGGCVSEVVEFGCYVEAMGFARSHEGPDQCGVEVSDCLGRVVWDSDLVDVPALLPGGAGFYRWDEVSGQRVRVSSSNE